MANINNYGKVTAVDASDQVFVSDAGTSLKKADIAAIAKYIVENYAGSTIGGSAQSVQSAIDSMKYTTVLSNTQFSDKAAVLAALDAYADSVGSQERIVGYISTTNSLLLGLRNTSHYFDFYVNSANYRLLVVRPASGGNIYQLYKQAGTWGEAWTKLVNSNEAPFVSSYTAATDTIDDIYTTGIYFIGNSVGGKPLGTTGDGTNGVLIVGGYNTKDANIMKLYIYLSQTTTDKKGIFIKTFAGTTGYGWDNIPTT